MSCLAVLEDLRFVALFSIAPMAFLTPYPATPEAPPKVAVLAAASMEGITAVRGKTPP